MRATDIRGKGSIHSTVGERLIARYGGLRNVNVLEVSRETGLSSGVIRHWMLDEVTRRDDETLIVWCHYFGVASLSELLEYRPADEPEMIQE